MVRPNSSIASLYAALAQSAPASAMTGETIGTRNKETVDNDAEAFASVDGLEGNLWCGLLTSPAPAVVGRPDVVDRRRGACHDQDALAQYQS